ncbi:hypothetical protein [Aquibaculum sediminis]|uniref:hypothetical protein n=1 Tax=Aquibaculum sediminis TaxID=3231907 RepID=UPI003456C022
MLLLAVAAHRLSDCFGAVEQRYERRRHDPEVFPCRINENLCRKIISLYCYEVAVLKSTVVWLLQLLIRFLKTAFRW